MLDARCPARYIATTIQSCSLVRSSPWISYSRYCIRRALPPRIYAARSLLTHARGSSFESPPVAIRHVTCAIVQMSVRGTFPWARASRTQCFLDVRDARLIRRLAALPGSDTQRLGCLWRMKVRSRVQHWRRARANSVGPLTTPAPPDFVLVGYGGDHDASSFGSDDESWCDINEFSNSENDSSPSLCNGEQIEPLEDLVQAIDLVEAVEHCERLLEDERGHQAPPLHHLSQQQPNVAAELFARAEHQRRQERSTQEQQRRRSKARALKLFGKRKKKRAKRVNLVGPASRPRRRRPPAPGRRELPPCAAIASDLSRCPRHRFFPWGAAGQRRAVERVPEARALEGEPPHSVRRAARAAWQAVAQSL